MAGGRGEWGVLWWTVDKYYQVEKLREDSRGEKNRSKDVNIRKKDVIQRMEGGGESWGG